MSVLRWLRSLGPKSKLSIIIGGSIIIGASTYAALMYYELRKSKLTDEGFVEAILLPEEIPEKRILVLGIERSGKSSFLSQLPNSKSSDIHQFESSNDDSSPNTPKPTEAFNVVSVQSTYTSDCILNFWEIGRKGNMRTYWSNYFQDTDLLIFCVDSSNPDQFPQAYDEFHSLLGDDRLRGVPILILATKQDVKGCVSIQSIKAALDINNIPSTQHRIQTIGVHVNQGFNDSVKNAELIIHEMCMSKS